jgi:signal transduction histidine kinase
VNGGTRRHGIGVQIQTRRTSRRFDEAVLSGTGERRSERVRELDNYWHELERYRQVEEALRQRKKFEEMGRHAAGITHDFNNLLTAIIGNTLLLCARS